jgi:hypothetical protein
MPNACQGVLFSRNKQNLAFANESVWSNKKLTPLWTIITGKSVIDKTTYNNRTIFFSFKKNLHVFFVSRKAVEDMNTLISGLILDVVRNFFSN